MKSREWFGVLLLGATLSAQPAEPGKSIRWNQVGRVPASPLGQIELVGSVAAKSALERAVADTKTLTAFVPRLTWRFRVPPSSDEKADGVDHLPGISLRTKDGAVLSRLRFRSDHLAGAGPALLAEIERTLREEPKKRLPTPYPGTESLLDLPSLPLDVGPWIQGKPATLDSLRGKVVLVRFFTGGCPFCAASMPALQKLADRYEQRGLVVLGLFHKKPKGRPVTDDEVPTLVKRWGVRFPVALDNDWKTLDRWWLEGKVARRATSASFLLDRFGRIRHVNPGPELHGLDQECQLDPDSCHEAHRRMIEGIEALL